MNELFDATNATDDEYIRLRDSAINARSREFAESLWEKFHPFADWDFIGRYSRNEFRQRSWEMYLGSALLDEGISLGQKKTNAGPDFIITTDSAPIWVEAVTPNGGEGPDAIQSPVDDGVGALVPENEVVLRLCEAIDAKHKAYKRYLRNNLVSQSDPYIIAINGCRVPLSSPDTHPPYIVRAVYPFGSETVTLNSKPCVHVVAQGYKYQPAILKLNGAPVSKQIFQDKAFAGISAVIYSCADPWAVHARLGRDFRLIHNPLATNPIPREWLRLGVEYWEEGNKLAYQNWEKAQAIAI